MAATIATELDELAEDFDFLDDWEDRYRHILDLGRGLQPLTAAEHDDAHKLRGCASQVWLVRDPAPGGRLVFRGDSDAHLVRGLIAILLRLYSGRTAGEILAFDAPAAVERLGLTGALSSQRANGLSAMVERIRREAASPSPLEGEGGREAVG
jgi:cysteine desulfuration protein SufE